MHHFPSLLVASEEGRTLAVEGQSSWGGGKEAEGGQAMSLHFVAPLLSSLQGESEQTPGY